VRCYVPKHVRIVLSVEGGYAQGGYSVPTREYPLDQGTSDLLIVFDRFEDAFLGVIHHELMGFTKAFITLVTG